MAGMPARTTATIAVGYAASLVRYSRLPGPYLTDAQTPAITAPLIALALPTTAAMIRALLHRLWLRDPARRADPGPDAAYHAIVFRITVLVVALHVLVLANLTGVGVLRPSAGRMVLVLIGIALMSIGNLLPKTRPNIVFGLRTRRLLTNRRLWAEMHRAAGYATVACGGVIAMSGALLPGPAMPSWSEPRVSSR